MQQMVSLLQILLLAQHVSGTIMPIIRSTRVLYRWLLSVIFGAVKMEDVMRIRIRNHLLHLVGILFPHTRVGTLIVATIYLQLIQNRYMFRSFTVLQCSHQHCVQHVASDVEVVGYL